MPTFSRGLEQSLHRALALANERHHEYATLEHLLLALIEDQDAAAVMRACNVDLQKLRRRLVDYLESELDNLITDGADDSKPQVDRTDVFRRLERVLSTVRIKPIEKQKEGEDVHDVVGVRRNFQQYRSRLRPCLVWISFRSWNEAPWQSHGASPVQQGIL